MSGWRVIKNTRTNEIVLARARCCAGLFCRLRGLQFVRRLPANSGLLFITGSQNRLRAAIHTGFMFFSIAVVWLDKDRIVVDKILAKPWRCAYVPHTAAMYYIEAHPPLLDRVQLGDALQFDEVIS